MKYKWGDIISLEYGKPVLDKETTNGIYPVFGTNGQIGTTNLTPLCPHASFILGRKGAYRGVHYSEKPFSVIDTAFYVKSKTDELDIKWAYYKFLTYDINRMDSGSAIPSTDRYEIYSIPVELPPLSAQRAIAAILSCLDDKIENNTKINHHLEQMAQAIFKSWFVDFEPWGGEMPNDWRRATLSDICSYGTERISVGELNVQTYISTENMLSERGGFVGASSLPSIVQTTKFQPGNVLVSNIRPYFRKIVFCSFTGGCSADVLCFQAREKALVPYLYFLLFNDSFFDYMVAGSKGTKMPRGDKQQIINYPVIVPTDDILGGFAGFAEQALSMLEGNRAENRRLAALRDTLLPRLMSGSLSLELADDI